jgi:hypothetical protein
VNDIQTTHFTTSNPLNPTLYVKMAVGTSTVTSITDLSSKKYRNEKMIGAGEEKEVAESAPPLEVKEHDFFWTYTEEPHRTRRQAIIKAHPEVYPHLLLIPFLH